MSLLYRLRRSVALFICPEMGVEDRLKAMRFDFGMLVGAAPASSSIQAGLKVLGGASDASQHCRNTKASQHGALQGFAGCEIGAAATTAVPDPVGPRVSTSLRAGWRLMVRLTRRIEDCWIGDFLGVCGLMFLLFTLPMLKLGFGGQ